MTDEAFSGPKSRDSVAGAPDSGPRGPVVGTGAFVRRERSSPARWELSLDTEHGYLALGDRGARWRRLDCQPRGPCCFRQRWVGSETSRRALARALARRRDGGEVKRYQRGAARCAPVDRTLQHADATCQCPAVWTASPLANPVVLSAVPRQRAVKREIGKNGIASVTSRY